MLVDSTGLEVFGAGQWLAAKHGAKSRRTWRTLHLAIDASSGRIVAHVLSDLWPQNFSRVSSSWKRLPASSPLRTGQAGFPAYGSSLSKPPSGGPASQLSRYRLAAF
ncbi:hypothetical protein [Actimicrobium sp. CCI2.3]|uniref:hypothetical protein n=1 Tax=Actimicrobium sp. CCI2.3 TaxID=3048616 RepID=UPI003A1020C0